MLRRQRMGWLVSALGLLACGPVLDAGGEGSGQTTTTDGPSPTTMSGGGEQSTIADEVTTNEPDPTQSTSNAVTTADATDTGDPFILEPDGGPPGPECSLWENDCPRGEKCMPYADDGGSSWNSTRCSPVADDPRGVGEECTVEGNGVSGIDDCEVGAMCWNVDFETNTGECVAFCVGSEANPVCTNECTSCTINSDGTLILCLPNCDPLAQDCHESQGCYAVYQTFQCAPDASGDGGAAGTPCQYINVCDPGNHCAPPDQVPGCAGDEGCCTPFCDVDAADPCEALLPGTTCQPALEAQVPDACSAGGTVGICVAA